MLQHFSKIEKTPLRGLLSALELLRSLVQLKLAASPQGSDRFVNSGEKTCGGEIQLHLQIPVRPDKNMAQRVCLQPENHLDIQDGSANVKVLRET